MIYLIVFLFGLYIGLYEAHSAYTCVTATMEQNFMFRACSHGKRQDTTRGKATLASLDINILPLVAPCRFPCEQVLIRREKQYLEHRQSPVALDTEVFVLQLVIFVVLSNVDFRYI